MPLDISYEDIDPPVSADQSSMLSKMKDTPRWLLADHSKKPFYIDGTPRRDKLDTEEEISHLATYDEARAALEADGGERFSRLGFALGQDPDNPSCYFQGIDLDDISIHGTQSLANILLGSGYAEMSPSGNGLHVIGYGKPFRNLGANKTKIEAYCYGRYFTFTGNQIDGNTDTLEDLTPLIIRYVAPAHGSQYNEDIDIELGSDLSNKLYVMNSQLAEIADALTYLDADDRDTWIKVGHALKTLCDERGKKLWFQWSETSDKCKPEELEYEWSRLRPQSITYKTIFHMAKVEGWIGYVPTSTKDGMPEGFPEVDSWGVEGLEDVYDAPVDIVAGLFPQEAGVFVGSGGTGKSTIILHAGLRMTLGLPVFDCEVKRPGPMVYVTGEDRKGMVVNRINHLIKEDPELEGRFKELAQHVKIVDLSHMRNPRLCDERGPTQTARELMRRLEQFNPSMVIIDPASILGTPESAHNDGYAVLMHTMRQMSDFLEACVVLVHHVGQDTARTGVNDQYAGRGGTAFSDGSRFILQLRSVVERTVKVDGLDFQLPAMITDEELEHRRVGILMQHKFSYGERIPHPFIIRRNGWHFDHIPALGGEAAREEAERLHDAAVKAKAEVLLRWLSEEAQEGRFHSKDAIRTNYHKDTEGGRFYLSRKDAVAGVEILLEEGLLELTSDPNEETTGRRKRRLILVLTEQGRTLVSFDVEGLDL